MNLERAFENLRPERRANFINENYVVRPALVEENATFSRYTLYNRPETFYEVDRVDFAQNYEMKTGGRAWTLSVVEGQAVEIEVANGRKTKLSFLESLAIPAAAEVVQIRNLGEPEVKLIRVAIKEGIGSRLALNDPIQ